MWIKRLFWALASVVVYTYLGYAAVITLLARGWAKPVRRDATPRRVTLLVAAYNEELNIAAKLENALALDYPREQLDIVVVTDGSTDTTVNIVASYADRGVRGLHTPARRGKLAAIERAMAFIDSEIVVMSDANAFLNREALRRLVEPFADPSVGCVAGEKRVEAPGGANSGEGLYWRYESYLKAQDSRFHSVVGAAGELFAVRRELLAPPPTGTILDDFVISMGIASQGYRVIYEPAARVTELESVTLDEEFERRARNAHGGWQGIWLLRDRLRGPFDRLWFTYVSHRVLRWTVAPALLPLLVALNAALARGWPYRLLLGAQIAFYALAGAGWVATRLGRRPKALLTPFYFVLTNVAALVGGYRFLRGQRGAVWARAARHAPETSMAGAKRLGQTLLEGGDRHAA